MPPEDKEPVEQEVVESAEEVKEEAKEDAEEVVDEKVDEEAEEEKDDRPAVNYKKELERKNRELERLRAERAAESSQKEKRYDPNDLSTWTDNDLKAVSKTVDPNWIRFKDQAEDILIDRKIEKAQLAKIASEKRLNSEMKLRMDYPEALDPTTKFSARMDEVMYEFDLDKSPAGRLAAAKIVAAEEHGAKAKAAARGRKTESDRVARVKGSLSSGDRPQGESPLDKKRQAVEEKMRQGDPAAFEQVLKSRLKNLRGK